MVRSINECVRDALLRCLSFFVCSKILLGKSSHLLRYRAPGVIFNPKYIDTTADVRKPVYAVPLISTLPTGTTHISEELY